jgi:cytoskeletal protein CcmA (bactofilin family)
MFSRSKITETTSSSEASKDKSKEPSMMTAPSARPAETGSSAESYPATVQSRPKPAPSVLSSDLTIKGNVITSGDVQVEGTVEGDIHAHLLTVGEGATVKGEVVADDVVVHGRVIGRLRGLKVRLTASAKVEGDIVHKTIAIESGAHFEGSVQRQEDPIGDTARRTASQPSASASQTVGGAARPRTETPRESATAAATNGG